MAASLPDLPDIERLSTRVIRVLGGNPGKFQLQGTNTYVIGTGSSRLLIDTGEGVPIWAEHIDKVLEEEKATVSDVLLTHWHPDHVGGVSHIKKIAPNAKLHKHKPDAEQNDIKDGQIFKTEGATLLAVFSPGHTQDHMAFVLQEEKAMFTGDNVLGHGTAVFEDLGQYMSSLELMKDEFDGRAYPGHGAVIEDGRAKIEEYITHRKQREQEALEVLSKPKYDGSRGWDSMEMVKIIYKAYPEALHLPAQGSLLQLLKKLQAEGKAQEQDGKWSTTDGMRL